MRKFLIPLLLLFAWPARAQVNVQTLNASGTVSLQAKNNLNTLFNITLVGNVTAASIDTGFKGQQLNFNICQNSVGGFTWAWPSTFQGTSTITISLTALACTQAQFVNLDGTAWQNTGGGAGGGIPSVTSLPACATATGTIITLKGANGVAYGDFFCGGVGVVAQTPANPGQTVSPLSYGALWDVKLVYDCTFTASTTVNCNNSDTSFTTNLDANKIEFGTSGPSAVSGTVGGVLACPQGTITTVNSANQIILSAACTVPCTPGAGTICAFTWGTQDDTTPINNAAAAAWNTNGICKALQWPSGYFFFSAAIMISATGNSCEGGPDLNSQGPMVFGSGPGVSVGIPLPSFNFASCTGGGSGTACIFGVGNGHVHDIGINGLQQSLPTTTHANNLFELTGGGGAACAGGTTAWNLGLAGWGLQSTSSTGFAFGGNSCNDPVIWNVNVQMFGARSCLVTLPANVVSSYGLMCFGSTAGALGITGTGTFNSFGGMYYGNMANFTGVVNCGAGPSTFNSFGDIIGAEFNGFIQNVFLCNGGSQTWTVNIDKSLLTLANSSSATSDMFFLHGATINVHLRDTVVTATGANNQTFSTTAGNNIWDECGNTTSQGGTANSIAGAFATCSGFGFSNTTAVTATNPSAATLLMEIQLPAGYFNNIPSQASIFHGNGVFTTAAVQTPTLTFILQLCTAVGGTGTCVAQATWVTNASTASTSNNNWAIDAPIATASVGATGTLMVGGYVSADLGATTVIPDTIQGNANVGASAATNLTVPLFMSLTVQMSSANAGNSVKQLLAWLK